MIVKRKCNETLSVSGALQRSGLIWFFCFLTSVKYKDYDLHYKDVCQKMKKLIFEILSLHFCFWFYQALSGNNGYSF